MRRLALAVSMFAGIASPAFAEDPPRLPPDAVRLAGSQIVALYDGKTFAFRSYTFYGLVTGEVSFDFTTGKNHGTYHLGSRTGTFDGSIRISRDRFCYKAGTPGERCNYVFLAGTDIYEVKPSGIVESVNQPPENVDQPPQPIPPA